MLCVCFCVNKLLILFVFNLELDKSQAEALVILLTKQNKQLSDDIVQLQTKYNKNLELIEQLKHLTTEEENQTLNLFEKMPDYSPRWPWRKKILKVMESWNGYLSARDIMTIIYKYEPNLKVDDRKSFMTMSAAISNLFREDLLKREKDEYSKEYKYIKK